MDLSKIDQPTKEALADRIANAVLILEQVAMFGTIQPKNALDDLLKVRGDLVKLVKELGGHPAIR